MHGKQSDVISTLFAGGLEEVISPGGSLNAVAGPDAPPKGYKGNPSDTREDAFLRMQVPCPSMCTILCVISLRGSILANWVYIPRQWIPYAIKCWLVQALLSTGDMASGDGTADQLRKVSGDPLGTNSSKSDEDLVPISAWLGARSGAAESKPERELAGSYAGASSNGAASIPTPSQGPPVYTSSSASPEEDSWAGSVSSSSSSTAAEHPPEEPPQIGGRGRQQEIPQPDIYAERQLPKINGVSTQEPADGDRDPYSSPREEYRGAASNGEI